MLILLDIDNTLVSTTYVWKDKCPDFTFRLCGNVYYIYLRPGLYTFLKYLFSNYDVGVWTAASRDYASCILKRLLGKNWRKVICCFLHRKHCIVWKKQFVKDLRNISKPCILIDDNYIHLLFKIRFYRYDGNKDILKCHAFYGDKKDNHFKNILRTLQLKDICQYV